MSWKLIWVFKFQLKSHRVVKVMEKDPQDTENNSKTEQQSKEQTAPKSERRQ